MAACRGGTAALFGDLSAAEYREQIHPGYSPLGWHLGHIAYTEAMWLVRTCAGRPMPRPEFEPVYHVAGTPKAERTAALPPRDEARDYVEEVRRAVFDALETVPIAEQEKLWRFVLQHESQHSETVAVIKSLWRPCAAPPPAPDEADAAGPLELVPVAGGPARLGSDGLDALDNEGPAHELDMAGFAIGRYPVTQAQFAAFMAAGGYRDPRWWSDEGWRWREHGGIAGPLRWRPDAPDHPVSGVSAYEAEAFCTFHGLRLPTEAEWEKAAAWDAAAGHARLYPWGDAVEGGAPCNWDRALGGTGAVGRHPAGASPCGAQDMIGNIWEWTASGFAPYPGFRPWPYEGYSAAYYEGAHRVLRGGSWATRPCAIRNSFRNWHRPGARELFAGFRVARDGSELVHDRTARTGPRPANPMIATRGHAPR